MPKTVYSLVLSSEVVAEADAAASALGLSRSVFIERVLAQHLALSTPHQRSRDMADAVAQRAQAAGLFSSLSTGGTLTLRTTLRFKYNPSVRYTLQLSGHQPELGQLRVSPRSQNEDFLTALDEFFGLWGAWETGTLPAAAGRVQYDADTHRYTRTLHTLGEAQDQLLLGDAVADYIQLLDESLKHFFEALPSRSAGPPHKPASQFEAALSQYEGGRLV